MFSTAAHVLFAKGSLIAPTDRVGTFIYTAVAFAAVFGWLFWDEGVDWLMAGGAVAKGSLIAPTDRVGTFIYTAVAFAAVFGWLFWDEGVDWLMAGGAVLIVAAGVIAIRAGRPGRERVP